MKERILNANSEIEAKGARLKQKVETYFAGMNFGTSANAGNHLEDKQAESSSAPYILYGVAGVSLLGVIASSFKLVFLGISAACAYGGFKLSKKSSGTNASAFVSSSDINVVRNYITERVVETVKKITSDWQEFMELKQREIRLAIDNLEISDNEKDELYSKIYLYEIIDIAMSEFYTMTSSSTTSSQLREQTMLYKKNIITAIENAVNSQIQKYSALI